MTLPRRHRSSLHAREGAPSRRALLGIVPAVLVATGLLASGCGSEPPRDRVTRVEVREIASADIVLPSVETDRDLPLRAVYPAARGRYPLIVLSHGGGSSKDMYSRLTDHWASRGYVALQPTHRDSASLGFQTEGRGLEQMMGVIRSRILDMRFVLDSLDAIESRIPALKGRIDREKIVAAGHSMGGFTAMSVAGLRLRDPRSGAVLAFDEPRYDALLLIGDPGNMALLPDEPWRTIGKPTFVATGTNDFSEMAKGRVQLPFRYELVDGASATPHHHLFIRGMDHYLGGLICRTDVPGPPDLAALDAIQTASTAFLDTYLKGRSESTAFLSRKSGPDFANGRATLSTR